MKILADWAARHGVSQQAMVELTRLFDPISGARADEQSEAGVQSRLRLEASAGGHSLWRNNNGACQDATGRLIRYGLGNDSKKTSDEWKSSDLIGITRVTITSRHIGYTAGIFTAVEVKEPGWNGPKNDRERAQRNFLTTVNALGGIGIFAQSVNDYALRVKQCD